jgi:hypothetical protein
MRVPKSLSFSSMSLWEKNPEEYYLRYIADHRPPRLLQEPPMAVGSAFDAYVKSALAYALFGKAMSEQFEFGAIFESQVEPQCRDFALKAGKHVWKSYKFCGAYDDLLTLLQFSVEPPRFEFSVEGLIGEAPFLGKPDLRFVPDLGFGPFHCIFDWKVKGYCSKYGASPSKGYQICLDGYEAAKPSRSHGKEHAKFLAKDFKGMTVNAGYMETCNAEYADQLTLYGWLMGEDVGDESIVLGIEETVAKFMGEGNAPLLRYARHRGHVKGEYQQRLFDRVQRCWKAVSSGHIFTDMSREDNDARCEVLEQMAVGLATDGTDEGEWFNTVTRPQFKR